MENDLRARMRHSIGPRRSACAIGRRRSASGAWEVAAGCDGRMLWV